VARARAVREGAGEEAHLELQIALEAREDGRLVRVRAAPAHAARAHGRERRRERHRREGKHVRARRTGWNGTQETDAGEDSAIGPPPAPACGR